MEVDEVFPQKLNNRWVWFWRKRCILYGEESQSKTEKFIWNSKLKQQKNVKNNGWKAWEEIPQFWGS